MAGIKDMKQDVPSEPEKQENPPAKKPLSGAGPGQFKRHTRADDIRGLVMSDPELFAKMLRKFMKGDQ